MSSSFSRTRPTDVCSVLLNNEYAKSVTVPEAKQHQDSYTVYKVILHAVNAKQTFEETPVTFIAWKRFRDLYKLHRRVVITHAQLYLKDVVPSFPKPEFFGRLEPSVIEERRQSAEKFVSFVVQNSVLCQCEAVLAFFSGAELRPSPGDSTHPPINPGSIVPSSTLSTIAAVPRRLLLGKSQESGRSFSESSDFSDDLPITNNSTTVMSSEDHRTAPVCSGSGGSTDLLATFDPFRSSPASVDGNNYQLLSEVMCELQVAVSESAEDSSPIAGCTDNSSSQAPDNFVSAGGNGSSSSRTDTESRTVLEMADEPNSARIEEGKKVTKKKLRTKIADFFPRLGTTTPSTSSSSKTNVDSSRYQSATLRASANDLKPVKSESQIADNNGTPNIRNERKSHSTRVRGARKGASSPSTAATAGSGRRSSNIDYVLQAAEFISSAQKAEDENAFDLAFSCYKSAVMLLLQGVQDEKDLNRRNAVRLKIAKYLKKAEKLYATYIASGGADASHCMDGFTSRFLSNFGIAGFQGVYSELAQYKVLRTFGRKVQLVQDITSGEKYIVKFLDKSCYGVDYSASKILDHCVPTRVPHMVKLVKFWDTDNAVIILLEYAAGGRLWRRLGTYFEKARRMFQRYCENHEDDEDNKHGRLHCASRNRSGSVDSIPALVNRRSVPPDCTSYRSRSGSDARGDRTSAPAKAHNVIFNSSSLGTTGDHNGSQEETLRAEDTTLFDIYEQRSMRPRFSADRDSFSVDTAPPSAIANRRFSFVYAHNKLLDLPNVYNADVDEHLLRKWIAQITVTLGYLHSEGVVCRDLNPDNLLLDDQDNVRLTFFCNWSGVDRQFDLSIASMLYSAPEVDGTSNEQLSNAADWWSLGVLLYEIATGVPLHTQCPHGVNPNTVLPLPGYLSVEFRDLITRLTQYEAEDRLGSCFGGADEIKMHPFFMDFNWRTVEPS